MTKPFLPKELTLRVAAILRRTYREEDSWEELRYQIGEREVDLAAVWYGFLTAVRRRSWD